MLYELLHAALKNMSFTLYLLQTALLRLQHTLEASRGDLTIRKLSNENLNIVLKEIKRSGTYHVVIDCGQDILLEILERVCTCMYK